LKTENFKVTHLALISLFLYPNEKVANILACGKDCFAEIASFPAVCFVL